jgi:hypothetical protein
VNSSLNFGACVQFIKSFYPFPILLISPMLTFLMSGFRDSKPKSKVSLKDALIAQETILKMIKPHRRTVEVFQSWMDCEADGRGVPVITGLSANRLLDASDLIALHPPVDQDLLTCFVRRYFRILFVVIRSA